MGLTRILYISYACPSSDRLGPARRHYHVLHQLSRFYDVQLLSLARRDEADAFRRLCTYRLSKFDFAYRHEGAIFRFARKAWRTASYRCDFLPALEPNLVRLCRQIALPGAFDAIFLSGLLLRTLPLPQDIPIIGDSHNVEFDVHRRTSQLANSFLRRQYARLQTVPTRREEQRCGESIDLLLATSERDKQLFEQELGLSRVAVIPNGVDITEFSPHQSASGQNNVILFTGLMSYYPNQQAMEWFLRSVFPLILKKNASIRLIIAGAAPPKWLLAARSSHVEVTGVVPDMRPYIGQANVVIAPLMIGGGTRVKILEAQAMAKPVVATSIAAEGLALRHGNSILIADDAESFSAQVVRLLDDADLATSMGLNGRTYVASHYDWDRIGERLASLLQDRIGLSPRASTASA